uniref:non-specific serine/threonine protein kinase n=1 Tax=Gongylonema pulchrum TaxID=637853 RepID=A0A183E5S0_9BILA
LLSIDDVIADRFVVEEKIGQGIKVEPPHYGELDSSPNDPRRLVIEQQVLLSLRAKDNIPVIYASGKTGRNCPYIVMQILGKNLTTLRKDRPEPKFTASTAFRVGEQVRASVAHALQYLHEAGYIHRDVKPSNCCIGAKPNTSTIYLVDFGTFFTNLILTETGGVWNQQIFF